MRAQCVAEFKKSLREERRADLHNLRGGLLEGVKMALKSYGTLTKEARPRLPPIPLAPPIHTHTHAHGDQARRPPWLPPHPTAR
jgi:hypothetical protein